MFSKLIYTYLNQFAKPLVCCVKMLLKQVLTIVNFKANEKSRICHLLPIGYILHANPYILIDTLFTRPF